LRGDDQLVDAWMRIRAASIPAADQFLEALRYAAALRATELVQAPVETIQMVQGIARGYADLFKVLNNAPAVYEKSQELKHNARHANQSGPSA
jgi:hypothetical protein